MYFRVRYSVVLILGIIKFLPLNTQYVQSPCPNIFEYRSDEDGIVYGLIHLQSLGSVSSIIIRTNFTIAARLPSSYVGKLEPIGSGVFLLQEIKRGSPLKYRVHFPVTSPLPRLTALIVNDNVLCYGPGDVAGPGQYVTSISLQHMLYLKPRGGSGPFNAVQPSFTPSKQDNVFDYRPSGSQTGDFFSFDSDKNNQQTNFNTDFKYQQNRPQPQPPQDTSQYPYYPSQVSQVIRPQPQLPQNTFSSVPYRVQSTIVECGVVAGGNEQVPLIYNGQTYNRGDWPWLVAIYKRKDGGLSFICSGTLVSNRHVVTAAHCMQQKNSYTSIRDIVVKVGVYNLEDWGDDITVTRTLSSAAIHESYNASTLANDILVFTFGKTVEFNSNIRPACLWNGNTDLSLIVGASGVVAGWGKSELGPGGHGEPRMVRIPIVSTATCRASRPDFHKLTSSFTLCAGDRNGVGPCLGDSGGGLYILDGGRWRIRGVVSLSLRPDSGDNTCNLNEYIVFTDTAQYLRWINTVLAS